MEAEKLQEFIRINGLKQSQVAEYLGIQRAHISNVLKGRDSLSAKHFAKLLANENGWDTSPIHENDSKRKKIPLYDDPAIGGVNELAANVDDSARPTEWIDAGDWFPTATSAIHHYGESMVEYIAKKTALPHRHDEEGLPMNKIDMRKCRQLREAATRCQNLYCKPIVAPSPA